MENVKDREIGEVFCFHLPDRSVYLIVDNCEAVDPCKGCYFDEPGTNFAYCEKDYNQTGSCNACLRKDNNNVIFRKVYAPKKN